MDSGPSSSLIFLVVGSLYRVRSCRPSKTQARLFASRPPCVFPHRRRPSLPNQRRGLGRTAAVSWRDTTRKPMACQPTASLLAAAATVASLHGGERRSRRDWRMLPGGERCPGDEGQGQRVGHRIGGNKRARRSRRADGMEHRWKGDGSNAWGVVRASPRQPCPPQVALPVACTAPACYEPATATSCFQWSYGWYSCSQG